MRRAQPVGEIGQPIQMQRPRRPDPGNQCRQRASPRIDARAQPACARDDDSDDQPRHRVEPDGACEIRFVRLDARHGQAGQEAQRDDQCLHAVASPVTCALRGVPSHTSSVTSAA